jgi:hypothetical protein
MKGALPRPTASGQAGGDFGVLFLFVHFLSRQTAWRAGWTSKKKMDIYDIRQMVKLGELGRSHP